VSLPHSLSLSLSLCHTPSLVLNEITKNQGLNKIVCSLMKNFNAILIFSIYNKFKEGNKKCKNINTSRNKKSLCKHENMSGKPVLDVS
jgi:hypothetical protein